MVPLFGSDRVPRAPRAPRDRRVRWRGALVLGALLPLGFGLQRLAALFPAATERWYARGLYPRLQAGLARASGTLPVSAGECLLGLLVLLVLVRLARGFLAWRQDERSARNLGGHALAQTLGTAGVIYAWFLVVWGFNAARQPFATDVGLEVRPATAAELEAVTLDLVERANARRAEVPDGKGALRLHRGKAGVLAELPTTYAHAALSVPVLAGAAPTVRLPVLSPAMTAFGIAGIYWPFTGEPHVNAQVPDVVFPFDACHEIAHQRGFAREDEANYIAYRVCTVSSDPDVVYSGVFAALLRAWDALLHVAPHRAILLQERCSKAVLRDWQAVDEFWTPRSQVVKITRDVGTRTNDVFLKSQGQVEGVRSYGRMVDLLIAEHRASKSQE